MQIIRLLFFTDKLLLFNISRCTWISCEQWQRKWPFKCHAIKWKNSLYTALHFHRVIISIKKIKDDNCIHYCSPPCTICFHCIRRQVSEYVGNFYVLRPRRYYQRHARTMSPMSSSAKPEIHDVVKDHRVTVTDNMCRKFREVLKCFRYRYTSEHSNMNTRWSQSWNFFE